MLRLVQPPAISIPILLFSIRDLSTLEWNQLHSLQRGVLLDKGLSHIGRLAKNGVVPVLYYSSATVSFTVVAIIRNSHLLENFILCYSCPRCSTNLLTLQSPFAKAKITFQSTLSIAIL